MAIEDRRRALRVPVDSPLEVAVLSDDGTARLRIPAVAFDLTPTGVGFRCAQPLEYGALVDLAFADTTLPFPPTVRARIAHTDSHGGEQRYGATFEDLTTEARAAFVRATFAAAQRAGLGATPAAGRPARAADAYDPDALEAAVRPDAIPPGKGPTSFVDEAIADVIGLLIEGDPATKRRYPTAAAILEHMVRAAATELELQRRAS